MKARRAEDRFPAADLQPSEIAWLKRVQRSPEDLQAAHYDLLEAGLDSTPLSRSIRAVALGRG